MGPHGAEAVVLQAPSAAERLARFPREFGEYGGVRNPNPVCFLLLSMLSDFRCVPRKMRGAARSHL
jgi:hypothetical protein